MVWVDGCMRGGEETDNTARVDGNSEKKKTWCEESYIQCHTYIHTYIHTYTHTHTHIHTYVHGLMRGGEETDSVDGWMDG